MLQIQEYEIALEKAVEMATLLKSDLSYVIKVNEELKAEMTIKDRKHEADIEQYRKELEKNNKHVAYVKQDHN